MIKCEWSSDGLWYTKSHKGEQVSHLFRVGTTTYNGIRICELIIYKFRMAWVK